MANPDPRVDTASIVRRLRALGGEPDEVEVKASVGGLPKSVPETLSAFANGSGGTLILGLAEDAGFRPAPGFDATRIRTALAGACADRVSPPVRASIEIEAFEGASVVRVDVPELDALSKPCFVADRGEYNGSFIRSGDGDRRLSRYEVSQMLSNSTQPAFDREPVLEATHEDLQAPRIAEFLARIRQRSPRFAGLPDDEVLHHCGVLTSVGGSAHPTLAGLLCFGFYPQSFQPQLFVSFVVVPGLAIGDTTPDGRRFIDNQTLDGSIPEMVLAAQHAAVRNMNQAAIITGNGRQDRYDYPLDVIREIVVNAVMHRDYSPEARGSQVQIEIYADRLEVRNPGGLHGAITIDELGTLDQRSTSRNALLAQLLTDIPTPDGRGEPLCENRGSGLRAVVRSLKNAGMSPPHFRVTPGAVDVVVPRHALLSDDVIEWLSALDEPDLSDPQQVALAIMRSGPVTNAMLQSWGYDRTVASQALADLVARGVAEKSGGRRYATYRLNPEVLDQASAKQTRAPSFDDAVLRAIQSGHTTRRAIAEATGLSDKTALRRLKRLVADRQIERTGPANSPTQSYRIIDKESS